MGYAMRHPKAGKGGRGKKLPGSGEFSGVPTQRMVEARGARAVAMISPGGSGKGSKPKKLGFPYLPRRADSLARFMPALAPKDSIRRLIDSSSESFCWACLMCSFRVATIRSVALTWS